ncbi:MAG: nucleotide disphospho-sugar-binding domain-containing protein [Desulfobacterales bacterium]
MQILIATSGTRGDVQPALALAVGLKAAGHAVELIAPPENRAWAEAYHCPFHGLGADFMGTVAQYTRGLDLRALRHCIPLLRQQLRLQLKELPRHVQKADLAVAFSLMAGLFSVADQFKVPALWVATSPQLLPSSHHPPIEIPCQRLPGWLNRAAFRWSAINANLLFKGVINGFRRAQGLAPIDDVIGHLFDRSVMVAADPQLAPLPGDAQGAIRHPGHFVLPDQNPLPARVMEFLATGSRPIYIGFGSMGENWARLVPMVHCAARLAGCRAILCTGRAKIQGLPQSADVLFTPALPHAKLFPQVAAVVHHGGAGTTATAARAGIPQIVVPHLLDQFYWARHVHHLGLGPAGLPQSKLNASALAAKIRDGLTYPGYRPKAQEMGRRLEGHSGVPEAIAMIESILDNVSGR